MQQLLTGRVRLVNALAFRDRGLSIVGQREIQTQKRVIAFFRDALGYAYLGHWKDREGNSHIEEGEPHRLAQAPGPRRQAH